ncbi:dihydrofolate reductase family protein [Mycolicibacterium lacusdiani]|uniref:dihydrofolate reductase family protein n=1 Tax=Mycolicibacterium lacusdiani TaxID=2895283 RepID=UPI001F27A44A|nr:dihydrofolate reductase family protein [Mycolicibacterium lacusdiani]
MACVYFTASSLDGFVVDEQDSLDWLTSRQHDPDGPFGIDAFMANVGALVMGSATYEWILGNHPGPWMYDQPSWVLTTRPEIVAEEHPVQTFSGEITDVYPRIREAADGKDVWLVGGGRVAAQFTAAGLVDQMIVTYAPCSLGSGARVLPVRSEWKLAESAVNGEFVCARWVAA